MRRESEKSRYNRPAGDLKRKCIKYITGIFLLAIIIYYFRDSWKDILKEIRHTPFYKLLAAAGFSAFYFFIEGKIIQRIAGGRGEIFSLQTGIGCSFYCALFRLLTFASGTAAAEIFYLHKKKVPPGRGSAVAVIQYMTQKITIGLYGILGFFWLYLTGNEGIKRYVGYLYAGIGVSALVVLFFIVISTSGRVKEYIFGIAQKVACRNEKVYKKVKKVQEQAELLQYEVKYLFKEDRKRLFCIMKDNFLKMTCWYLIPVAIFWGTSSLSFDTVLPLMAVSNMLAGVIPAPGGFGSVEGVFYLLFAPLAGKEKAMSAVLIYRFAVSLFPAGIGALVYFLPDILYSVGQKKRVP